MYRTDTKDRYKAFLNEWWEYSKEELPITTTELLKKYGVSSSFGTYVTKQQLFAYKGSGPHGMWTTKQEAPFTDVEVSSMIAEYNGFKYKKKNPPKIEDHVLNEAVKVSNGELSVYATQDLINEIKKRGYTGSIVLHKEIKF